MHRPQYENDSVLVLRRMIVLLCSFDKFCLKIRLQSVSPRCQHFVNMKHVPCFYSKCILKVTRYSLAMQNRDMLGESCGFKRCL